MKLSLSFHLVYMVLLGAGLVAQAAQRNIFDDDWQPPKSSETPRPAIKLPTPPNDPSVESTKPVKPAVDPVPAVTEVKAVRRAVPAKAEQAASRKVLKEVYSEQLVDRSVASRRKLAEALLSQAKQSEERPADQFVLLAAAIDAAMDAANLPLAFQAGDKMARAFEVDELAIKTQAAAQLNVKTGITAETAAENVRAGIALADQLADVDDVIAAGRVLSAILPLSAANSELRADVQKRQRDLVAMREAREKLAKSVEKLATSPEDPAANFEVGKYLCFFKADWQNGLPALAKGNNAALKELAAKELAGADTPDARMNLGDAWWDAAQAASGPAKAAIQAHAMDWYRKAAPDLKGLAKAKVDKRLAFAEPTVKRVKASAAIDLLKLIDIERDKISGSGKRDGDNLVISGNGKVIIPFTPKGDYLLQIRAMRQSGNNDILIYFPVGDTVVTLVLSGWGGLASGLEKVDNLPYEKNKTSVKPGKLVNGKWYDIAINVSGSGASADVMVQLDQKEYIHWHGAESELSSIGDVPARVKREKSLMLGSAHDAVDVFESVKIIQSGEK